MINSASKIGLYNSAGFYKETIKMKSGHVNCRVLQKSNARNRS